MTSNTISPEEGKTDKASNDDPVETHQQKPNEGTKKAEEGSNSSLVEAVVGNNISDEAGESEATGETSIAEKLTDGIEAKEQVPKVTAKETSSGSDKLSYQLSNKKNKKQSSPSNAIKTPNAYDVLLGRGKPFQNHDGNQSMLRIVDMYRKRYHESERAFKHEIIEEVLDIIKSRGGRFLERIDDFEKSFWNQVPHRMAYRKVGHAFRSIARRISMEKRDQAHNQQRNASAMARASMMSQFINCNEDMMQRMPMQAVSLPEISPMGRTLGIGSGGSGMYHQGGGAGLNQTQRELLAQEQMLHSSRIERILGNNNRVGATSSNCMDSVQSMLGGDSLPLAMGGGNIAANSLQMNNMRRMMLLGSAGGVSNQPTAYHFANSGAGP